MRKSLRLILSFTFVLLLLSAAKVSAQTSGEITGLVTDSSGAAVSGATATVTNKATGAARKVVTNSEGLYSFPSLMPGVYELKVEQAGFKTARLDNIALEVQQAARLEWRWPSGLPCPTANATPSRSGWKRSTCSTILREARRTETSWRAPHFRERPPTPRVRASALSSQRPSRCASFNWG